MPEVVEVSSSVINLDISIAYVTCSNISIVKEYPNRTELFNNITREILSKYNINSLKDHSIIRAYRGIMWRLGIDPTKVRPSNEALIRRVLKGKPIPYINNVVDACNLASILYLVPISVFDLDKIRIPLIFRKSRRGEKFIDLTGSIRELSGSELVVADSLGNILHLYPHRDSKIACITNSTRNIITISYGAPDVDISRLRNSLTKFIELLSTTIKDLKCSNIKLIIP